MEQIGALLTKYRELTNKNYKYLNIQEEDTDGFLKWLDTEGYKIVPKD